MATTITSICPKKETRTAQGLWVLPPSTNVCSNIKSSYVCFHTFEPLRAGCVRAGWGALGAATGTGTVLFRASAQLCQNSTMGLATNTEEYVPIIIPTTKAKEKPCNTGPPKKNNAMTVRKV